jgi:hypothetical protein
MFGRTTTRPRPIPALGAAAQPVRFLEYLLAATEPAVIAAGAGILVNVPNPARFALHNLVIAQRRPAATQTKALKDILQARELLSVLVQDRPGDVRLAWEAASVLPQRFQSQLAQGLRRLPAQEREKAEELLR